MEKDWLKRPSDRQLQEAQKKTDRVIHNAWGGGSPCPCTLCATRVPTSQAAAPPSRSTLTGAELATGKKKNLASIHTRSLWSCSSLCDPVDCGLPGFSVRGVLQARILECISQYWLPYPSRALYFLLP